MVKWFGSGAETVTQLHLNQIVTRKSQPRQYFSEESLMELSQSIREMGVIQPVIVRKTAEGYELIAGERRLRAARIAGLERIPAIIKDYSDQEVAQASLIENVQREDLNPLEEACAYDRLLTDFGLTQEALALKLGKSQSTIANKRRLLKLAPRVQGMLGSGALNERQARAILRLTDEEAQSDAAEQVVAQELNVRQTDELIEEMLASEKEMDEVGRPVRKIFVRDVRIFLNTIRSAVGTMKKSGFDTRVIEKEDESHYEFIVRISKKDAVK